jgi:hypothetical protein
VYIGMIALVANVLVAAMFTAVSDLLGRARKGDATAAEDYADARGAAG